MKIGQWQIGGIFQKPTYGSRWYRGIFTLGLMVDSHPRFFNVIVALWFVEIGVSAEKAAEPVEDECERLVDRDNSLARAIIESQMREHMQRIEKQFFETNEQKG